MRISTFKLLDQIPINQIYAYLEQKNATKEKNGKSVGADAAEKRRSKHAKEIAMREWAKQKAL